MSVAGTELLRAAQPWSGGLLGRALSLEVLPNRDALPYAALYGIDRPGDHVAPHPEPPPSPRP